MREEKAAKIYIETTLAGPCVKDGWYAAIIEYQTSKGPATKWTVGMEKKTTYHRSVLLAIISALKELRPWKVVIYTGCSYIIGSYQQDRPEGWSRSEWKKPDGEDVKNKDLWKQLLDEVNRLGGKDKITFQFSKHHDYKDFLMKKYRKGRKSWKGGLKIKPKNTRNVDFTKCGGYFRRKERCMKYLEISIAWKS